MQNRTEKRRDIARSVLPSSSRHMARKRRSAAHRRERAMWRQEKAALCKLADPDDHEGDLRWAAKSDLHAMVHDRRLADKTSSLVTWARARIESSEALRDQDLAGRLALFRGTLPGGLVGAHALSHLEYGAVPRGVV